MLDVVSSEEEVAHWDHDIYSVGAAPEAGESPTDATQRITRTLQPGWELLHAKKTVAVRPRKRPVAGISVACCAMLRSVFFPNRALPRTCFRLAIAAFLKIFGDERYPVVVVVYIYL
jgi:hypothetical protein